MTGTNPLLLKTPGNPVISTEGRNLVSFTGQQYKIISFKEEYIDLMREHGIEFDEKYLF